MLSEERATGSGTLVSCDGYIVTNAHLVSNAHSVQVILATPFEDAEGLRSILKPTRARLTAEILGTDAETDLAVLKIAEKGLPFLEFGNSDELRQGQLVMAFGSPLGLQTRCPWVWLVRWHASFAPTTDDLHSDRCCH